MNTCTFVSNKAFLKCFGFWCSTTSQELSRQAVRRPRQISSSQMKGRRPATPPPPDRALRTGRKAAASMATDMNLSLFFQSLPSRMGWPTSSLGLITTPMNTPRVWIDADLLNKTLYMHSTPQVPLSGGRRAETSNTSREEQCCPLTMLMMMMHY